MFHQKSIKCWINLPSNLVRSFALEVFKSRGKWQVYSIIKTWHFVLSLTPCISTRSPLWVWVGLRDNVLSSVPAALLWISPMPFICGNSLVGQQNLGPVSKCMLNVSSLLFCCHPIFSFGRCKYQLKLAELHDYCCAQIVLNFSGNWTQLWSKWALTKKLIIWQ